MRMATRKQVVFKEGSNKMRHEAYQVCARGYPAARSSLVTNFVSTPGGQQKHVLLYCGDVRDKACVLYVAALRIVSPDELSHLQTKI
ncbi:hypothetical protein ABBQ38_002392 [Trebouxia sp. C0009 RCD-2024]